MYINVKLRPAEIILGMWGKWDKGELYINCDILLEKFVNATRYPQHNNKKKIIMICQILCVCM
jgi:hypothetical protein